MRDPNRLCGHAGCQRPYYGADSCKSHYMKAYREARTKAPALVETRVLPGRPINEDRAETIWRGIVQELGIAGASQRRKAF